MTAIKTTEEVVELRIDALEAEVERLRGTLQLAHDELVAQAYRHHTSLPDVTRLTAAALGSTTANSAQRDALEIKRLQGVILRYQRLLQRKSAAMTKLVSRRYEAVEEARRRRAECKRLRADLEELRNNGGQA